MQGRLLYQEPTIALALIVDDEEAIVAFLVEMIEEFGHRAVSTTDSRQALLLAHEHLPDFVITDVMMPFMDGYTLLQAIRADVTLAKTPVYLMSAAFSKQAGAGAGLCANGSIAKPFSIDTIEALVSMYC